MHGTSALLGRKSPLLDTFCKLFLTQALGIHGWESSANSSRGTLCCTVCTVLSIDKWFPFRGTRQPNVYLHQKRKEKMQVRFEYAGWSASQPNHNCGKHTAVSGFALTSSIR
jgi:hypothetical protein